MQNVQKLCQINKKGITLHRLNKNICYLIASKVESTDDIFAYGRTVVEKDTRIL